MATATSVKLNRFSLNKGEAEDVHGARWSVFVSPYDVPEEITGSYDPDSGKCVVRFRYMAGDEAVSNHREGGVLFGLGRRSSRLYEIEPEVGRDRTAASTAPLVKSVADALVKLAHSGVAPLRQGNYKIVKTIIDTHGDELFAALLRPSAAARSEE